MTARELSRLSSVLNTYVPGSRTIPGISVRSFRVTTDFLAHPYCACAGVETASRRATKRARNVLLTAIAPSLRDQVGAGRLPKPREGGLAYRWILGKLK